MAITVERPRATPAQEGREAGARELEHVLQRFFRGSFRAEHHGRALYGQEASGAVMAVEFMKFVGAEFIFGIPGGASLPLNDALTHGHQHGAFQYVLTGHEQGAAFEAEGYAAASGRCGWCTGTSGPGATNLITGLADAFRDSRPVIALTGNTATTAEPEAFQAIDIVGITHGKATKASFRPERPEDVQELIVRAYHTAMTGRPGSVLVDLPKDVQTKTAVMRPWEELIAQYEWLPPRADEALLKEAARRLAAAQRPVLYAGHGVILSGAADEVREISRRFQIPVATTVHGLGVMEADDPLNLGMIGMHGTVVANLAPYLSDLTVALGARFDDRVVGAKPDQFAPASTVIHIDVDARQLNRVRKVDLAIHSDVKDALRRLLALLAEERHADRSAWLQELGTIRQEMPVPSYDRPDTEALSHEFVYGELSQALAEAGVHEVVATFDVGTHQMKGAQWFPVSKPRSFITSGGMGSMGCALPMASGASYARPDATVIACVGDGGFVMSTHELDTIGGYQIPVKILLFDDSALGMVTNWHGLFFEGRDLTSDRRRGRQVLPADVASIKQHLRRRLSEAGSADGLVGALCEATVDLARCEWPIFAAQAAAYGIPAERVRTKEQFRQAVRRMLDEPGPYLIQIMLPTKNQVFPLIQPGTTPQDLVWRETQPGSGVYVRVAERFDYQAKRLRTLHEMGSVAAEGAEFQPPAPERDHTGF
jgi:acetolactate synthase-1/2/3 large subunit